MFLAEIDQGEHKPDKKLELPYLAMTRGGKLVLVLRPDHDQDDVYECIVLRAGSDALKVGDAFCFDGDNLTPLVEGKSVTLTNTWEIING